ncbi:hypothetical protein E5217_04300 [Salmonella enterica subsp. enterica serovar Westhampton]|nr:hypothetical protein [Salmonella enterica subsp. enterica serovar Westhampton]ECJ6241048.1 hypothetical protein [Salmonella enterica subsp. enterica]HBP6435379.1 hypothetical protein [Pseudomonas aeruginosa]ECF4127851.1 hypothetical protein [Salmonella enterica subsp. enterica serovar Westhampton]ECF4279694.1 hypothetical protein [Salmonella enterica subsp. enterica serovar Westhampton]
MFKAQSQSAPAPPSGRRRRGCAQVALCAGNPRSPQVRRRTAPPTFRTRPAAMGGTCGATPPACCRRLCKSGPSSTLTVRRLYVTKDGSPTRRLALQWSFHATPQVSGRKLRQGRFHLVAGRCPCPCQGTSR